MSTTLKQKLATTAAIAVLGVTWALAPASLSPTGNWASAAFAKNGGDDGGHDSGHDGDHGSDHGGDHDGGHGSDDGPNHDAGDDNGGDRNGGRGRGRGSDDGPNHHVNDDSPKAAKASNSSTTKSKGGKAGRPEIELNLSSADLAAVLSGAAKLVDNLGRVLEVEIEFEHGVRTVVAKPHGGDAKRNPGPITSVTVTPKI